MKNWFLVVTLMLFSTYVKSSPADIPVEAFFKNPQFEQMVISPDGEHIAVIYRTGTSSSLAIMDSDLKEVKSNFNFGEYQRIFEVLWPRNDRFILGYAKFVGYLDDNGEPPTYVAYNIDGSKGRQLTNPLSRTSYNIISLLPNKPDKILVTKRHYFDDGDVKLFEIDLYKGKEDYTAQEPRNARDIIADSNGIPRFAYSYEETDEDEIGMGLITFFTKDNPDSKWRTVELPIYKKGTSINLLGFNADNTIAYASSDIETKVPSVYSINMKTMETKLVHKETVSEISGSGYLYNGALEVVAVSPDYNRTIFLDEKSEMKRLITQLYASLGVNDENADVNITSWTSDGNKLIVNVSSDKDPGVYYIFNRGLDGSEPSIRFLSVTNNLIDPKLMADLKPIQFESRDGLTLNGYMMLPTYGEAPYPMIQIIHGGPHGPRDYWGWNREAQFLASRGYAVVMVNFRGSGGYGQEFTRAGYEQWGGTMINDMTDATLWMVENGYADKDRLCVYGGSYGGYGTLQSVVREPDLYKCGLGYVGVYSLIEMKKSGDIPKRESGRKFLDRVLGTDEDKLIEFSPALNVEKIKADLFIAHGSEDVRVPMDQYEVLSENLKRIGKPYKSMIREEGHGYQQDKNKYDFYHAMEAFFEKNLKN